jgi:hypothetical protein
VDLLPAWLFVLFLVFNQVLKDLSVFLKDGHDPISNRKSSAKFHGTIDNGTSNQLERSLAAGTIRAPGFSSPSWLTALPGACGTVVPTSRRI